MSIINFARIDHRLIHGQVMTKWLKIALANKIVIVDDYLATESFMLDVYKLSAPSDVEVDIISTDRIQEFLNEEKDKNNKIFLLFKDVDNAYRAYKNGLGFKFLQLGGIPKDENRKSVFTAVSLGENEINKLSEMENDVEIVLQIIPEESKMTFKDAKEKYKNI